MNLPFLRVGRHFVWTIVVMLFCNAVQAQKEITLSFDETGRLISPPESRYEFPDCKNCEKIYTVKARVLLPIDNFKEEKVRIEEVSKGIYDVVKNRNGLLHRILSCGNEMTALETIVGDNSDITKWKLPDSKPQQKIIDEIIPQKLLQYVRFIRLLDSIASHFHEKPEAVNKYFKELNDKYLDFVPYRLYVKGNEIQENCMRFVPVALSDNDCKCLTPGKKYIAVEFAIPTALFKEDLSAAKFQVKQYFVMKQFAIQWYNELLNLYKPQLDQLKTLQDNLRKNTSELDALLAAYTERNSLINNCVETPDNGKIIAAQKKIDSLKKSLEKKVGAFFCDSSCSKTNLLFCSTALPGWLLRLLWLNGDLIRLNPFAFTNNSVTVVNYAKPTEENPVYKETELPGIIASDTREVNFYTSLLSHFQDSAGRSKTIGIDAAKDGFIKINALLKKAQLDLEAHQSAQKKYDEAKAKNAEANKKNAIDKAAFLTTYKVQYSGWIVPFELSKSPQWVRNYNYANSSDFTTRLRSQGKFMYSYPEPENLSLLVHNLKQGMSVKVVESFTPAKDSSAWNIFAADAIKQITQLYASVLPITGIVKNVLQPINAVPPTSQVRVIADNGNQLLLNFSNIDLLGTQTQIASELTRPNFNQAKKFYIENNGKRDSVLLSTDKSNSILEFSKKVLKFMYETKTLDSAFQSSADSCAIDYLTTLKTLREAPDLIDKPLIGTEDTAAAYFSYYHPLNDSATPYKDAYTLYVAEDTSAKAMQNALKSSSFVSVYPYHYFSLAAGIAFTPNAGFITSIDTTRGGFTTNRDNDKARLIVGVRWYPTGLYNQKNPTSIFQDKRWTHRLSILAATGIPKPLENLYAGAGIDVFAGLTLTAGYHFQQQNQYEIANNQIVNKNVRYRGHLFYSLTMDPTLFISAITSIFKK